MSKLREAAQMALEALNEFSEISDFTPALAVHAMKALHAALAEPEQEMPSDTRYTVAVEGQAPTYWDCIHDAMTNAQRAVYSGVDNATRAIDDLKAGRIAEWSYGFSAVRIYPPQSKAAPTPCKPQTTHWEGCEAVHPECKAKAITADEMSAWVKDTWEKCQAEAWQEPVAWVEPKWIDPDTRGWPSDSFASQPIEGWLPLYTAPTPRQWVSLTEQEMYDLFFNDQYGPRLPEYLVNTIKCVEAALKEKNDGS